MSLLGGIPIIGKVLDTASNIISKNVADKDLAAKLTSELNLQVLQTDAASYQKELDEQAKIITAESQGSWMQKNWRPCLMFLFMLIIFNNYILQPYLQAVWSEVPILPVPDQMWKLITMGTGGYLGGRTVEKVVSMVKGKN